MRYESQVNDFCVVCKTAPKKRNFDMCERCFAKAHPVTIRTPPPQENLCIQCGKEPRYKSSKFGFMCLTQMDRIKNKRYLRERTLDYERLLEMTKAIGIKELAKRVQQ